MLDIDLHMDCVSVQYMKKFSFYESEKKTKYMCVSAF